VTTKEPAAPGVAKKGDLVCMFRRRKKGCGLVLEYVEDINKKLNYNVVQTLEIMNELGPYDRERRRQLRQMAITESDLPALAFDFFTYNDAWAPKLKTKFVYVKWIKRPSEYISTSTQHNAAWYPVDWLRVL
jgi:hypothetical protein